MKTKDDSKKTKTANASIMDGSYQVALATQSIFSNVWKDARDLTYSPRPSVPWKHHVFLPMIVTTAELFSCRFEATEISDSTGEIPLKKVAIEEIPYLIYEFPLSKHLQAETPHRFSLLTDTQRDELTRLNIVIVNSRSLKGFVDNLLISQFLSAGQLGDD
jgi:hypothetical protein